MADLDPPSAPSHPPEPSRHRATLRWMVSIAVLAATVAFLDLESVLRHLHEVEPWWIVAALAVSIPQIGLMAWRWHFTASRVGAALPFSVAWREYYVSLLLNQVIPGGVVGDVTRIVRQAEAQTRPVARVASSVFLERVSGQLVLWLAVASTLPVLGGAAPTRPLAFALGALALVAGLLWALAKIGPLSRTRIGRFVRGVEGDLRSAFVSRGAFAIQLGSSILAFGLLAVEFWLCGKALGSPLSMGATFVVVPWILGATSLPLTAGGWGVREAAAGAMFGLRGSDPSEAVAVSIVFGAVALVSVLPGSLALLFPRPGGSR